MGPCLPHAVPYGLLQKTFEESVETAKANSSVACICNPTCPGCGCQPGVQYCSINGVETLCPSSGYCQDAAYPSPTPTPVPLCRHLESDRLQHEPLVRHRRKVRLRRSIV